MGDIVANVICSEGTTKVRMSSVKDVFGQSGTPEELMKKYNLTAEAIVKEVKSVLM